MDERRIYWSFKLARNIPVFGQLRFLLQDKVTGNTRFSLILKMELPFFSLCKWQPADPAQRSAHFNL